MPLHVDAGFFESFLPSRASGVLVKWLVMLRIYIKRVRRVTSATPTGKEVIFLQDCRRRDASPSLRRRATWWTAIALHTRGC